MSLKGKRSRLVKIRATIPYVSESRAKLISSNNENFVNELKFVKNASFFN